MRRSGTPPARRDRDANVSVKGIQARPAPALDAPGVRQTAGDLGARGLRFALVVSRFNETLTARLAGSALDALAACGAAPGDVEVVWVPGAYEIPFVAERLAADGAFAAVIALGCVIQGETPHAGLVNTEVARGLADIARRHGVPVIDGVVAAHTEAQAVARCTRGPESRGWYAATAAVEMARLCSKLGPRP